MQQSCGNRNQAVSWWFFWQSPMFRCGCSIRFRWRQLIQAMNGEILLCGIFFFFCVLEFYWWLLFLNTFADTNSMVTFCGIFSIISRCRWLCSIVSMRLSVWSTFGGIRMSQHRWNIDCIHRLLKISTQSCTNMKLNLFVCFNRNFVWIILIVTHFW